MDVSAVWWEAAGITELAVVTACETSVSLWRHEDTGQWGTVYTWHFTEVRERPWLLGGKGERPPTAWPVAFAVAVRSRECPERS